jgi:hypothetical protein
MKNNIFFPLIAVFFALFGATSCNPLAGEPDPPVAAFDKTPLVVIADETPVKFENTSEGEISSYQWTFENGLSSSSQENPVYTFQYEGTREVKLTVTGPGGSDTYAPLLVVFPEDPSCNNYGSGTTHNTTKIQNLRDNNLVKQGKIYIYNDYSTDLEFLLYSPGNWMQGYYGEYYKYPNIPTGIQGLLKDANANPITISNEWGIRIRSSNGVISCIRNVGAVADSFTNGTYHIRASDIYEGN